MDREVAARPRQPAPVCEMEPGCDRTVVAVLSGERYACGVHALEWLRERPR